MRVVKWWVLVVGLAVAGGGLAAFWSVTTATTTWTATAALTSQSQGRSPEQDGVLALGYVDYFNQESYQELLRAQADVPGSVELSAQTGASSPIIYIQASGPSQGEVRDAASNAAEVFREDVRESLVVERRQAVDDLQAEIDNNVQLLNSLERTDVEKNVILDQVRSLQGRLTEFLADNTNHLKQLQPEPGMSSSATSPVVNIVSGTAGGAVLGILIALVMAMFDRRVHTADDVRDAGLPVLAELDRGQVGETRTRLRNLLNGVAVADGDATPVIAVASVRSSHGVAALTHDLLTAWSARRGGALHVLADLRTPRPEYDGTPGLVDVLEGRTNLFAAAIARADGQWVLPPGDAAEVDPYAIAETEVFTRVLEEASMDAGLVVIESPPILEAPESQSICAAADRVILLVDAGRTRSDDVQEALGLLRAVHARVVGAVLDRTRGGAARPAPPAAVEARSATDALPPGTDDGRGSGVEGGGVEGSGVEGSRVVGSGVAGNGVEGNGRNRGAHQQWPSPAPRDEMVAATSSEQVDSDRSRDGTWQS
jgi:capsular polysaccharide biosynthesis protein